MTSPWKTLTLEEKILLVEAAKDRLREWYDQLWEEDRSAPCEGHIKRRMESNRLSHKIDVLRGLARQLQRLPTYADLVASECRNVFLHGKVIEVDKHEYWFGDELLETFFVVTACENVSYVTKGAVVDAASLESLIANHMFIRHGKASTWLLEEALG